MLVKTYNVIEYSELFGLIGKELGVKPELDAVQNDTCYSVDRVKKLTTYSFDTVLDRLKTSKSLTSTHLFIQSYDFEEVIEYLVNKDILPEGNYLVDVCW